MALQDQLRGDSLHDTVNEPSTGSITFQENPNTQNKPQTQTKRARWATTRVNSVKARQKRSNIMRRLSRSKADEKKAEAGGSSSTGSPTSQNSDAASEESEGSRRIYFNQPLPPDMKDENGNPTTHYDRNKIRTARYTPLTFIPKNLYWQFHQVANVFFLIMVILGVSTTKVVRNGHVSDRYIVLLDIYYCQSLSEHGSPGRYRNPYNDQGCDRRLAKNNS